MTDTPTHVWYLDCNRRIYRRDESGRATGSPIRRESWVRREIIGETSRSWLTHPHWHPVKLPKKGPLPDGYTFSKSDVEDDIWLNENRYRVNSMVERLPVAMLRQVAALIGYEPTP